ncbi:hypothetical protein ACS0TY_013904 [Phlomoides rotata]
MAYVVRPLIHWPRWRHRNSTFSHLLILRLPSTRAATNFPFLAFFSTSWRQVHFQSRASKLRDVPSLSVVSESGDDSSDSSEAKKSRNEKKREARRTVRWGMELANFSPPQIKRILRVADLEQEVFDALMLVKRLGRDVREGKRRQYNYIGGLLREAEPELMDGLIQATKDGDQSKFQELSGGVISTLDNEDDGEDEISEEDQEEDSTNTAIVTRWYDGLINKDVSITNEIYSLREVEFDRQELRELVRKLQSALHRNANPANSDDKEKLDAAVVKARTSLTRFLRKLANQLPDE